MSTVTETSLQTDVGSASQQMQASMAAVRLSFTWLGVRKTLSAEQKTQAADSFNAEGKFISAGKKLLDTNHPAFKAVTALRGKVSKYWRDNTLPYPEPGIRLIRRDQIAAFTAQMSSYHAELQQAVDELERHFDELRQAAQHRLGELFNPSDYPSSIVGAFAFEHDYPAVDVPDYLRQVSPELYQQECDRVQARFAQAVTMAEQAFMEQLAGLVDHLTERLAGNDDGHPKIFRDTAIENLSEFFDRFRQLNIGSSDELEQLVHRAESIVAGIRPQQLRDDGGLRQHVATQMANVQASLDGLLVDRPRRRIVRRSR